MKYKQHTPSSPNPTKYRENEKETNGAESGGDVASSAAGHKQKLEQQQLLDAVHYCTVQPSMPCQLVLLQVKGVSRSRILGMEARVG